MITKTQRWLDLIVFLVKRHFPVSVDEVMEGVPAYRRKWRSEREADRAAVRRMFERDKDEIRAAGVPLETVQYSIEHGAEEAIGYRLAGTDFYLPYLRIVSEAASSGDARPAGPRADTVEISREEAETAAEGLYRVAELPASPFAREARSALRKLSFDLDLDELGTSPVLFLEPEGTEAVRDRVARLTDALRGHRRVRFRYHGIHRGEPTDRDVAPYGLLFQHGQWYLIGHDDARDDIRVFRLGRMEEPELDGPDGGSAGAGEYMIPDGFDVADYARRDPWELGDDEPIPALVRFDFPLSLWADRNGYGDRVRELEGGVAVRRFAVRQVDPFLRWLQSHGGAAIVEEPRELAMAQADMARATRALYESGHDHG